MHECTDHIPDMSCLDSKCSRHRQHRRYEARLRAGLRLYPAPIGAAEINALVALGWRGAPAPRFRQFRSSPRSFDTAIAKILKLADKTSNLRAIAARRRTGL